MAQQVNTAAADYINPGQSWFTGGLYIPILPDTITPGTPDPPVNPGAAAIGSFGDRQWMWDITNQIWIELGDTEDVVTDTFTVVADGSDSVFTWLHGLGFDPTASGYTIDPQTAPAQGIYSKSANATHFTVSYDVCPVGTLTFNTTAKQP